MSKTSEQIIIVDKNCIAKEISECQDCELDGLLLCKFDKQFARRFMLANISYRLFAITIFVLTGLMIGHWWMLGTYTGILVITFTIIEPRLLCSHCPYYEMEGKFLKCWALRGMPKLWKYRPEPIANWEKILMLIFGSYIDLFPFVGIIWGIVVFAKQPTDLLYIGIALTVISGLFTILAVVFGQVMVSKNCKRCPNFSCGMNRAPKELGEKFLDKNPKMKKAWEQ